MTSIAPLPAPKIYSSSPPASSSRWGAASKPLSRTCSSLKTFGKTRAQFTQTASTALTKLSGASAVARNNPRPALVAVFKSP
jgi:hypothetical protein